MKKTILTKDIELNITTKTAGKEGVYLFKQDEVGGHVVTLGANNVGEIYVDPTPNVTTELKYRIDDELVFWTSTVLNPAIPYTAPAAIDDLQIEYVNTTDVKIKWTAPVADPNRPTQKVNSYTLVCSETMLTESLSTLNLLQMQKQKLDISPLASGEEEVYIIRNLIAGKRYFLNVISENNIRGKLLRSNPSNIEVFFTPYDAADATSVPSLIPLRDSSNRVYTYFTMPYFENPDDPLNENNLAIEGKGLANQRGVANYEGEPDGVPQEYGYVTQWANGTGDSPPPFVPEFYGYISGGWGNPYNQGWYNFDNPWIIFDLDGAWDITSIWIYVNTQLIGELGYKLTQDSRRFEFKASEDGTNWTVIGSIDVSYGENGWTQIDIDTSLAQGAKYFVIGAGSFHLGAVAIYGVRSTSYVINGLKHKTEVAQRPIEKRFGVNAFLGENDIDMMSSLSSVTRWYNEGTWVLNTPSYDKRLEDVPDITPDDVKYQFATSELWDYIDKLQQFKDADVTNLFTLNTWVRYTTPTSLIADEYESKEAKPLDPYIDKENILETTNPFNYKHIARMWWNIVAKLGSNTNPNPDYIQLADGESTDMGLDLIQYGEAGNERDAKWAKTRFQNPEESAAVQSAVYDGHKGAMGEGYGVKDADENFKLLNGATTLPEPAYFWRMMKWWDAYRGIGDYPVEALSYHHYSTFQNEPEIYTSADAWARRPERKPEFGEMGKFREMPKFRNTYMPNKELWLTEIGYSEHLGGSCAPNYPTANERALYKSYWNIRSLILNMYSGADIINLFWYSNHGESRVEDLVPNVPNKAAFATHGLTDGITWANDWNRKYLTAGWYIASFRNEIAGYHLKHAVKIGLEDWTMTNIIPTVDPTLYAFAVENPDTEETGILMWYSDMELVKKTVKIKLDISEITVDVVRLDGAETRQNLQGVTTTEISQTEGLTRFIEIQLGECPVFVKTKNIGIEKLKPLKEIRIQSISQSAIKLTWTDENVGNTHKTKIFMSSLPNEGYTIIHNDIISNGEYMVSGLDTETNYFFRIQLEDGAKQSEMTTTYGASTLYEIVTPSSFTSTGQTTSAITLNWAYEDDEEEKIDKFILYRNSTSIGTYTQIATIAKSLRAYTNTGLLTDVRYYYKLMAVKGVSTYSQPVFYNVKTHSDEGIAPTPLAFKTTYLGDKIYVRFDRAVKDVANNEAAFTIHTIQTDPLFVDFTAPIAETLLDDSDATLVIIEMVSKLPNDMDIYLSYDDSLGTIVDEDTNAPLVSFNDEEVENNVDSTALLSKKVNINFINGDSGASNVIDSETWNNLTFPSEGGNSQYQGDLKDKDNENSNWRFLLPWSDYPVFINKWDSEYLPAYYFSTIPSNITDLFPISSLTSGNMLANWAPRCGFKVSGLDTAKTYNLYFSVVPMSFEDLPSTDFTAETLDGSHSATWTVSKSGMTMGAIYNLSPNVGSFSNIGSTAKEFNGSTFDSAVALDEGTNDIAILFTNQTAAYRLIITALVIEEVNPFII